MTPEQKLNHLRDWIGRWIDAKTVTICAINDCFYMYDKTGMLWLSKGSTLNVETFDQYLQVIENSCKNIS